VLAAAFLSLGVRNGKMSGMTFAFALSGAGHTRNPTVYRKNLKNLLVNWFFNFTNFVADRKLQYYIMNKITLTVGA